MKKILGVVLITVLSGCASTPNDYEPKFHDKAKTIEMFEQGSAPEKTYEILQFVRSNSCSSKSASRFTGDRDEAKLLLRLEAATVNADAIVDYKCWTNPVDMVSNCWASQRCEGNAVKYSGQQ